MKTDYRPIRNISSGGMAEVILAEHIPTRTLRALKVLRLHDKRLRERILQEGRIQSAFRHPNIVPVAEVFELSDGSPALAMEYIDGPDLDQLVANHRMSIGQCDQLGRAILQGMSVAHRRGFVHRDLKPGNILVERRGSILVPRITDFGLAKTLKAGWGTGTYTGMVMGTPGHMAPEQFRGSKHIDARSDVFALGTILYELMTGERCFPDVGVIATHELSSARGYKSSRELAPDLPERMHVAVHHALSPEVDDRPNDASDLMALWTADAKAPTAPWANENLDQLMLIHRLEADDLVTEELYTTPTTPQRDAEPEGPVSQAITRAASWLTGRLKPAKRRPHVDTLPKIDPEA